LVERIVKYPNNLNLKVALEFFIERNELKTLSDLIGRLQMRLTSGTNKISEPELLEKTVEYAIDRLKKKQVGEKE